MRTASFNCLRHALLVLACCTGALASLNAQEATPKPEIFLLLPEPRSMRTGQSLQPAGAEKTVLSPCKETSSSPFIETYTADELRAMGISPETFADRAKAAADRLLKDLQPEWIRDDMGRPLYAVYRGERPIYASLLVAPSLPRLFEAVFGTEIWLAAPDRHALYVFPAKSAYLEDFAGDLQHRYENQSYAATCEIFSWKKDQTHPQVIGSFDH